MLYVFIIYIDVSPSVCPSTVPWCIVDTSYVARETTSAENKHTYMANKSDSEIAMCDCRVSGAFEVVIKNNLLFPFGCPLLLQGGGKCLCLHIIAASVSALQQACCAGKAVTLLLSCGWRPLRQAWTILCTFVCNKVPSLAASKKRKPSLWDCLSFQRFQTVSSHLQALTGILKV